jgi:hypothetical protein
MHCAADQERSISGKIRQGHRAGQLGEGRRRSLSATTRTQVESTMRPAAMNVRVGVDRVLTAMPTKMKAGPSSAQLPLNHRVIDSLGVLLGGREWPTRWNEAGARAKSTIDTT